jgi:hypothetical protein
LRRLTCWDEPGTLAPIPDVQTVADSDRANRTRPIVVQRKDCMKTENVTEVAFRSGLDAGGPNCDAAANPMKKDKTHSATTASAEVPSERTPENRIASPSQNESFGRYLNDGFLAAGNGPAPLKPGET